jgi:uncharacterized membrane protein YbjE (DUF340 family)
MLLWSKSKIGRIIEGAAWALDVAIGFGLVTGSAVAIAFGKYALSGIFTIIAFGFFLRFKRDRKRK